MAFTSETTETRMKRMSWSAISRGSGSGSGEEEERRDGGRQERRQRGVAGHDAPRAIIMRTYNIIIILLFREDT